MKGFPWARTPTYWATYLRVKPRALENSSMFRSKISSIFGLAIAVYSAIKCPGLSGNVLRKFFSADPLTNCPDCIEYPHASQTDRR